ncbi:MAG: DUF6691 family protein [Novosphingobium sp.]
MRVAICFLVGLLFGTGLAVSGMTSPDKVLGFLDLAGAWDPSLAFVMGGAVLSAAPLYWLARRRARPVAGTMFDQPSATAIDARLIGGSALFGLGWGLAGICPGPALVGLAIDPPALAVFVLAMLAGAILSGRFTRRNP